MNLHGIPGECFLERFREENRVLFILDVVNIVSGLICIVLVMTAHRTSRRHSVGLCVVRQGGVDLKCA